MVGPSRGEFLHMLLKDALIAKDYVVYGRVEWMVMEYWKNDTYKGKR